MASVAGVLALAPGAHAATVSVTPLKPCYRSGETIGMSGTGFTPGEDMVNVTSDGQPIGSDDVESDGTFVGDLGVASPSERVKTYTATDQSNPANTASVQLRVSPFGVFVSPPNGPPGRRLRIVARGFTSGTQLWAHVVRRGKSRNLRIGRLRGPCRRLRVRKRLFRRNARPGTYAVQFDTRRRYSRKTRVKDRFRVTVFRTFG
jgi:hypothetical protein